MATPLITEKPIRVELRRQWPSRSRRRRRRRRRRKWRSRHCRLMRTFSGDKELGVSDLKKKKEKKKEHKSRAKRATVLRRRYRKKRKKRTAWEGGGNNKMGRRRCRRRIKRCRRRPFALASDRIVKPKIHQSARTLLFLSSIRFEDRFTFDSLSLLFQQSMAKKKFKKNRNYSSQKPRPK